MVEWRGLDNLQQEARGLVAEALQALDVRNLVLGIHDPSFPSDPDEDTGRGSPYTRGAARFLEFARQLGFTGIQLGPQGQTSEFNASPYDSTLFSRNTLNIPLAELTGEPIESTGVDGCGAPLFSASLTGLAHGFRTIVTAAPGMPERRVADAFIRLYADHPEAAFHDRLFDLTAYRSGFELEHLQRIMAAYGELVFHECVTRASADERRG